jgi:hypothetical protein
MEATRIELAWTEWEVSTGHQNCPRLLILKNRLQIAVNNLKPETGSF